MIAMTAAAALLSTWVGLKSIAALVCMVWVVLVGRTAHVLIYSLRKQDR